MNGAGLTEEMGTQRLRYGERMVREDNVVERPKLRIAELGIENDLDVPSVLPRLGYT